MNCKICKAKVREPSPIVEQTQICDECRARLGIELLTPARRGPRPCAHCSGQRFIRVIPREQGVVTNDAGNRSAGQTAPMTATMVPNVEQRLFAGPLVWASVYGGVGRLEMYICSACGFIEWHCVDPEEIPIGPEYMTEVIDYGSTEPYR